MPFKEGTKDEHVHELRALVAAGKVAEEKVDASLLTPQEAFEEFARAVAACTIPAPKKAKKADA